MTSAQKAGRLARSDWTEAAVDMLLTSGIDAVQITRLAEYLSVSRGSFYWHFADRSELLESLLLHWREINSQTFEDAITSPASLSEAVLAFFSLWCGDTRCEDTCFSPQLDQAIRDWARLDASVFASVQQEDQSRIALIGGCFERFGYEKNEAPVRARVLYFAQIGYCAMYMEESMDERMAMLESYYTSFTGRKLNARAAENFRQRYTHST